MNIKTLRFNKIKRLINNMCCLKPDNADDEPACYYFLNKSGKTLVARTAAERDKLQSMVIDKDIRTSKKFVTNAIKILVLGIGETGKTTIVQSLRFKHDLVREEERQRAFLAVQLTVCRTMTSLLKAKTDFNIKFEHNGIELVLAAANFKKNFDCNTNYRGAGLVDFWDLIEILWKDENLKALAQTKIFLKV